MAEIAAASEQQSHGIDQVNASAEQMSQLTQQTAANAQESAATAEELSGQAEEMKSMVASFKLTQAAPDQIAQVRSLGRYSPTSSQPQTKATPVTVVEPARGNERGRAAKTDPKRIIPLDEKRMDVLEEF
jgi:methyl-accepting chemotaxis protein